MSGGFKIDRREFDAAIRKYVEYSKRDIPTIVNTKAFYIARRATVETPSVSPAEIREYFNRETGQHLGMMVNARRGKRGDKGLYGKDMAKAIALVKAARLRARAFLKSGWLWAVKDLEPYAEKIGAPRVDRKAKAVGQAKGKGIRASQGWRVVAKIINTVTAKWDKQDGAAKVAEPALQRAIDFETASTLGYIERKMKASARKAGIKTR